MSVRRAEVGSTGSHILHSRTGGCPDLASGGPGYPFLGPLEGRCGFPAAPQASAPPHPHDGIVKADISGAS